MGYGLVLSSIGHTIFISGIVMQDLEKAEPLLRGNASPERRVRSAWDVVLGDVRAAIAFVMRPTVICLACIHTGLIAATVWIGPMVHDNMSFAFINVAIWVHLVPYAVLLYVWRVRRMMEN